MALEPHDRDAVRWAVLPYLLLLGAVVGAVAGLLEALLDGSTRALGPHGVFSVAAFYGLVWAGAGVLVGALGWILTLLGLRLSRALLGSFLVSLAVFVLVGAYVNIALLPGVLAKPSLVADAVLLAACVALMLAIFRTWRRRLKAERATLRRPAPLVLAAAGLGVLLAALGIAGTRSSERDVRSSHRREGGLNVILVVVDALRADHLGCYGYERETSPNIDAFAREGTVFTNAYAQGSRTKEATASLVTSLYPSTHRVWQISAAIPEGTPTLPALMKGEGYRTAVLSANPLVSPTFGFGYGVDSFYVDRTGPQFRAVLLRAASQLESRIWGFGKAMSILKKLAKLIPPPPGSRSYEGGDATTINREFLSWVDEAPAADFFAYLHYMEPHAPYEPPPPFDEMFNSGDYDGPKVIAPPRAPTMLLPFSRGKVLPEGERLSMISQYDGSIAYFDREFGRLLTELERRGLAERTLIVLTADHGEEFYDHGGWEHGQSLFNELVHVPLIVWGPGRVPAGVVAATTIRHVDVPPTLLGAVGAERVLEALHIEGVNYWPFILSGAGSGPDPPAVSEVYVSERSFARSLVADGYKLIHTSSEGSELVALFDLTEDPGETHDLSEQLPDIAESMLSGLVRLHQESADRGRAPGRGFIDDATREKLRALGYVE